MVATIVLAYLLFQLPLRNTKSISESFSVLDRFHLPAHTYYGISIAPFYGNLLKCPITTSNYQWMILIMDNVFKCHGSNGAIYVVDKYVKVTPSLR